MFGYGSDIAIVHGAFLTNAMEETSLLKSIDCIVSQIQKYCDTHSKEDGGPEKIHRRINAALFVSLIRVNFKDESIIDDFESVLDLFPNLTWELYLRLLAQLDWRPYFIECLLLLDNSLQNDVTKQVFQYVNVANDTDNFNSYLNHCLLQFSLSKPATTENISCFEECVKLLGQYNHNEEFYTFSLDTIKALMERMIRDICNSLNSSEILSIPVKGKFMKLPSQNEFVVNSLLKYKELIYALENIFESCTNNLKKSGKVHECLLSMEHFVRYVTVLKDPSFESDDFDQLQIIKYKLEKMVEGENFAASDGNGVSVIKAIKEDLKTVNELCLKLNVNEVSEELLSDERARDIVEYLIASATARNTLKSFLLLIKNKSFGPQLGGAKKIFLDICCEEMIFMSYQDKMELLLDTMGIGTQCLRLRAYREMFTTTLNQSVEGEVLVEKKLLSLCLQAPLETLTLIINHAVHIGGQTSIYSKMLIFMAPICEFPGENGFKVLTEVLRQFLYDFPSYQTKEKQNFIALVEELIQDESLVDSHDVMNCFLHVLDEKSSPVIWDTVLLIVNEILSTEAKRGKTLQSVTKLTLVVLVWMFCKLINHAVQNRNGPLRERVLLCLDSLKALCTPEDLNLNYIEEAWLSEKIKYIPTSDLAKIAAGEFYGYDIELYQKNTARSYILCCVAQVQRMNVKLKQKKDLTFELSKILTYVTKQEWCFIFEGLVSVWNQIPACPNLEDALQLLNIKPTKKNTVLAAFIDSLVLMGQSKASDIPWSYMINSFVSMVQTMFLETKLSVDELHITAGQLVYLVNTIYNHQEYVGKMSEPLTNLTLQLISQCKTAEGSDNSFLKRVFELVKDDHIKNMAFANLREAPLDDNIDI